MTDMIWVRFERYGFHRYPDAPNAVDYLKHPHRHKFYFKVHIEVFHNDREIEFHMFLNWLLSLYDESNLQLDYKSCEMMIDDLAAKIGEAYPNRFFKIDVSEDNECGAVKEFAPRNLSLARAAIL